MESRRRILIACGACGAGVVVICGVIIVAAVVWLATSPEGGVRLSNEMEEYALNYLKEIAILNETEDLIAYYDATLTLNGSEAVILTTDRIIYHNRGQNESMNLADIDDIQHESDTLLGDIFTLFDESGRSMRVEIAPLNGGSTFNSVLMNAWQRARGE